jgi:hypothetical protein
MRHYGSDRLPIDLDSGLGTASTDRPLITILEKKGGKS